MQTGVRTVSYVLYLFGVLRLFQHCTGHITTGSWKGRRNQYIQFVRVLYCKLPTNGKQLPAFPLEAMPGIEPRPQRWEARVLPLCLLCTNNDGRHIESQTFSGVASRCLDIITCYRHLVARICYYCLALGC